MDGILDLPSSLRVVSLNCWGLKFISKHRAARLGEIGRQLATASPAPHIVGLQEVWTQEDYLAIRAATRHVLPHAKFYWSGMFGGGLAILSRWPIEESNMFRYPLNGRPAAFWRGDWFVGKGVASARIRIGGGGGGAGPQSKDAADVVEVFCTHLHAPYEREPHDSYLCHRTAQAWEMAKLMRHAAERGHLVLGLGDFNMIPLSLAHRLIEAHAPVRDVWRLVHPHSAIGSADDPLEVARRRGGLSSSSAPPSARQCLVEHGATCDSTFNTWRWSKAMRKDLDRGREAEVDADAADPRAKRLDYIFFAAPAAATQTREGEEEEKAGGGQWRVADVQVGFTMRHPELRCSLSDHFSVETTLTRAPLAPASAATTAIPPRPMVQPLDPATYAAILDMTATYMARERRQRAWRERHFFASLAVSIGCLVAVWWSPHNYVAFLLMLLSTLGLSAGVLDGLMGFLFVKSELRALKEFEYEVRTAKEQAERMLEAKEAGR